jgi:hypothetical protein
MAYEERDGQGTLFVNKRKQEGDNKPDREGTCTIDGTKYRIAGWLKTPKNGGDKFLSLKIQPADDSTHPRSGESSYQTKRPDAQPGDDQRLEPDGDVPF